MPLDLARALLRPPSVSSAVGVLLQEAVSHTLRLPGRTGLLGLLGGPSRLPFPPHRPKQWQGAGVGGQGRARSRGAGVPGMPAGNDTAPGPAGRLQARPALPHQPAEA